MRKAKKRPIKKKAVKAGTSKADAKHRRALFIDEYIANGGNATQAAIKAGFSKRSAYARGHELVKDREIQEAIEVRRAELRKITGLTAERTLREVARIAYFDPRTLFKPDGTMKSMSEMDDDTAAALAQIENDEIKVDGTVLGVTRKLKVWDKNSALEKAMKHLGLYEKDNKQQGDAAVAALLTAVAQQDAGFAVKSS